MKMNFHNRFFIITSVLCVGVIFGLGGSYWYIKSHERSRIFQMVQEQQEAVREIPLGVPTSSISLEPQPSITTSTLSDKEDVKSESTQAGAFNLAVPFFPQAPEKKWDAAHEDYCEEASLLGVHAFLQGITYTVAEQEKELSRMHAWQMEHFGYFESTSIEQTARIAQEYLGYSRVRIIDNPTIEDIRALVSSGRPVIIPAYGKELKNPYFKNGGPMFHMFVVRGFTATGDVIVNEPGTQHGENFVYTAENIMRAMRDWDHGQDHEKIPTGTPRILVIE